MNLLENLLLISGLQPVGCSADHCILPAESACCQYNVLAGEIPPSTLLLNKKQAVCTQVTCRVSAPRLGVHVIGDEIFGG